MSGSDLTAPCSLAFRFRFHELRASSSFSAGTLLLAFSFAVASELYGTLVTAAAAAAADWLEVVGLAARPMGRGGTVGRGRRGRLVRGKLLGAGGRGPSNVSGWGEERLPSRLSFAAGLPEVGGRVVGKCMWWICRACLRCGGVVGGVGGSLIGVICVGISLWLLWSGFGYT